MLLRMSGPALLYTFYKGCIGIDSLTLVGHESYHRIGGLWSCPKVWDAESCRRVRGPWFCRKVQGLRSCPRVGPCLRSWVGSCLRVWGLFFQHARQNSFMKKKFCESVYITYLFYDTKYLISKCIYEQKIFSNKKTLPS